LLGLLHDLVFLLELGLAAEERHRFDYRERLYCERAGTEWPQQTNAARDLVGIIKYENTKSVQIGDATGSGNF
jgi:hypothetical protein